ncbi:MAG: FG-GAP-like repeat-containing protein [Planctomycetota bacterium]
MKPYLKDTRVKLIIITLVIFLYVCTLPYRQRIAINKIRTIMNHSDYESAILLISSEQKDIISYYTNSYNREELYYLKGICFSNLGRIKEALQTLNNVKYNQHFLAKSQLMVSDIELEQGNWRVAEENLIDLKNRSTFSSLSLNVKQDILLRLDRYYRMQCRFKDAAEILKELISMSDNPFPLIKDLWITVRGTPPYETIEKAIKTCQLLNPDDSRLWLAKSIVLTQRGQFKEADKALGVCELPINYPDKAVHLARMRLARATQSPQKALVAARKIEPHDLTIFEKYEWAEYFAESRKDLFQQQQALEFLYVMDPLNTIVLSKYSDFAYKSGRTSLSLQLREKKAIVDIALETYGKTILSLETPITIESFLKLAESARNCGMLFESRIFCKMLLKMNSTYIPALQLSDSLFNNLKDLSLTISQLPSNNFNWIGNDFELNTTGQSPDSLDLLPPQNPVFHDDSKTSKLNFTFNNGETTIRQMPVALSGGIAIFDFDNDGWQDLFVIQGGSFPYSSKEALISPGDRLFRNLHNGDFEDVTSKSGLPIYSTGYSHGVAIGDINNDGFSDIFITRFGSYLLYINLGNGTFRNATANWNLDGFRDWPTSAAFADLDNDGDLDLYVCHYVVWDELNPRLCRNGQTLSYMSCNPTTCKARSDHLFRNDQGKFIDISDSSGITQSDFDGRGLGVIASDLDKDGLMDLFIANDKSANFLFHNKGNMKFEEVAQISGLAGSAEGSYQAGMGVACGDYDKDGDMDLAVTNYYGESTTLYQNLGGLVFSDRTSVSGLAAASRLRLGFGIAFSDFNNDGLLDLFTANGHTDDMRDVPYKMPAQLLLGQANGRWFDTSNTIGEPLSIPHLGRGLAVGDMDNDGFMDGILLPQNEPVVYFHNITKNKNHWITLKLIGLKSNHDGVGCKVTLNTKEGIQFSEHFGGGSYQSSSDQRIHFGFMEDVKPDLLEIRWPSGTLDRINSPSYDTVLEIIEGSGEAIPTRRVVHHSSETSEVQSNHREKSK